MKKNSRYVIGLAFIIVSIFGLTCSGGRKDMKDDSKKVVTVSEVDVEKYMGRWYEIASIPVWFQKDCAGGTTANYELKDDGTVRVINQCFTHEGKLKKAKGRAWVVDETTNAKLKVSFLPFGLKLFGGDYWIIDLAPDYSYAVVGHPTRKYGWILARTPDLPEHVLKNIISKMEKQGYDFKEFKMTDQKTYVNKNR
jgi:apolipoprotein D and lipocalin family protein